MRELRLGSAVKSAAFFLVDDEALLRMMTAEMLEELGHRVVAEAGTISAAEPLARDAQFDLAVLDINVGGNNIAPIAQIIANRGLPFIFCSGYGSEGRPQSFQDRPALRKPFLIESLAAMIEKVLGNRPAVTSLCNAWSSDCGREPD
jgi:CheY-like chemotaxis protein